MLYRKARKNTYSMFESLANNLRFLSDLYVYYRNAFLRLFLITLFLISNRIFLLECQDKETYIPVLVYTLARRFIIIEMLSWRKVLDSVMLICEQEKREALRFGIGNRVYSSGPERLSDHTQSVYAKKIAAKRKFMNPSCRNSGTLSCSSRRRGKLVIVALYDRA